MTAGTKPPPTGALVAIGAPLIKDVLGAALAGPSATHGTASAAGGTSSHTVPPAEVAKLTAAVTDITHDVADVVDITDELVKTKAAPSAANTEFMALAKAYHNVMDDEYAPSRKAAKATAEGEKHPVTAEVQTLEGLQKLKLFFTTYQGLAQKTQEAQAKVARLRKEALDKYGKILLGTGEMNQRSYDDHVKKIAETTTNVNEWARKTKEAEDGASTIQWIIAH